ncbi:hypothetical protein CONCODRAFT_78237 [Conidiobolus coronatus NRRL 28638]|uniref:Uncharacterized protein n=1 Tax=Conidiobolus coronatus (strain ATCC 28846 / CBS 209.66 / NRRL 28638) TaxID=796925 RepID=A0A137P9C6_CONC2|nr:hypothetical protein CONCODRAFT_78237 [Conidiobolus coronatus NRRL 28638]|eukprot:KXN71599.1 hypothetical protein CONCODRAFT_78237 [Conidiobolus coronatus NRRL 28638]
MNTSKFSIDQILSSVPDRTVSEVKIPEAQVSLEDKIEDKQQVDFVFPKEHRRVSTNSKIPVPKSYKLPQSTNQSHKKSQSESRIPTPKSRRHTLSEPITFKESILTAEKPNFKIKIETELKPCKRIQLKPAISNINELMKTNQSISQSVNWYQPTPKSRLPLPAKFNHREGVPV